MHRSGFFISTKDVGGLQRGSQKECRQSECSKDACIERDVVGSFFEVARKDVGRDEISSWFICCGLG